MNKEKANWRQTRFNHHTCATQREKDIETNPMVHLNHDSNHQDQPLNGDGATNACEASDNSLFSSFFYLYRNKNAPGPKQ